MPSLGDGHPWPAADGELEHRQITRFVIGGGGHGSARFWACELTHGYIDINGSYRT